MLSCISEFILCQLVECALWRLLYNWASLAIWTWDPRQALSKPHMHAISLSLIFILQNKNLTWFMCWEWKCHNLNISEWKGPPTVHFISPHSHGSVCISLSCLLAKPVGPTGGHTEQSTVWTEWTSSPCPSPGFCNNPFHLMGSHKTWL